jgi:hypothetical protein
MAPYDFEHGLINASFGEHDEPLVLELTCFQLPFRGHWGVKKPAGRSCVLFCDNKIAIEDWTLESNTSRRKQFPGRTRLHTARYE